MLTVPLSPSPATVAVTKAKAGVSVNAGSCTQLGVLVTEKNMSWGCGLIATSMVVSTRGDGIEFQTNVVTVQVIVTWNVFVIEATIG